MAEQVYIAVPVRNGERLIAESLSCLASQSHRDLEIVVYDNASEDATAAIAREAAKADSRIRVEVHERNIGAAPNFRCGLRAATSRYFLWRAYDDLSDERYVESSLSALQSKPSAALAAPTVVLTKFEKGITRRRAPTGIPLSSNPTHGERRTLLRRLEAGWIYGVFRRDALVDVYDWVVERYPFTWASDYLILAVFSLRYNILAAPDSELRLRLTGAPKEYPTSEARAERRELVRCYWNVLNEALKEIQIGWFDKFLYRLTFVWHIQRRVAKWPVIIEAALLPRRR